MIYELILFLRSFRSVTVELHRDGNCEQSIENMKRFLGTIFSISILHLSIPAQITSSEHRSSDCGSHVLNKKRLPREFNDECRNLKVSIVSRSSFLSYRESHKSCLWSALFSAQEKILRSYCLQPLYTEVVSCPRVKK
jgi:hypothetical protein